MKLKKTTPYQKVYFKFVYALFISISLFSCSNEDPGIEETEIVKLDSSDLILSKVTKPVNKGYYKIKSVSARSRKISVNGSSNNAGANVIINKERGSNDQIWYFDDVGGAPGWFQIKMYNGRTSGSSTDKYLTAGKSNKKNGNNATVKIEKRRSRDHHQQWKVVQNSSGSFAIINRKFNSSRLDIQRNRTGNGSNIHIYRGTGGANQKWTFQKISTKKLP